MNEMTSSEVAAWVQAVGSLLALAVAFFVVWWQHRAQANAEGHRKWSEAFDNVQSHLGVLKLAELKVQTLHHYMKDEASFSLYVERNLPHENFGSMRSLLVSLPKRAILSPGLVLELLEARDVFKLVADDLGMCVAKIASIELMRPRMSAHLSKLQSVAKAFEKEWWRMQGIGGV